MLKSLARNIVRKFGFELVPIGAERILAFEVALRDLLRTHQIDLVLDVGANHGQYAAYLRRAIGYGGQIISFEPSPKDFAILELSAANDPLWDVYPWAMGEQESTLSLNVAESSDFSSFLQPTSAQVAFPGNCVAEQVLVPVKRLDDVLATLAIDLAKRKLFIKSDTQGYDLQVFRGARRCVCHAVGVQTELSAIPIYETMPDYLDSLAEMRRYGLEVIIMSPVSMRHGVAVEFDCLMLKRDRLSS